MAGSTQYKNNWQKANLDRISLTVPKGKKEQIQDHASVHHESINSFISRAIDEAMDRDRIFEQNREKVMTIAQKHGVDINEDEAKKLAEAFAILEPQVPNIRNIYFSTLKQKQSPDVIVIVSDAG